jgi:2',3'-cyclic-nucleotide 2'-phosphodiesterase (5'-nucleotidase family)
MTQFRLWPTRGAAVALAALLFASCTPSKPKQEKKAPTPRAVRKERPPRPPTPRLPEGVVAPPPADAKKITLLYSSNLDGEYDAHPLGGLARRATMTARAKASGPFLQVDAGDSWLPKIDPGPNEKPPEKSEIERRAKLMAEGLGRLNLDAYTPGEQELMVLGPAKIAAMAKKARLPILSANLLDKRGKPWFEQTKMIELNGVKIGLFGINTLPFADKEKAAKLGITVGDALGATQGSAAVLREKGAQVVIGLFHLVEGPDHARELARAVDGIDILVLGHTRGKRNQRIRSRTVNIAVIEADRQGRLVGKLDIYVNDKVVYRQEYHRLDDSYVSDEKMQAFVRPYILESKRRAARKLPVGLTNRPGSHGELASATEEKWTYASTAACVLCHPKAQEHFVTTPHAFAMQTLERKGREKDPECLRCHSTGFDRPGGTRNLATAVSYFGDVGCESCHGPSSAHVRAQNKTGTKRMVPEQVCVECHTKEQSPEPFDYVTAIKAVLGKGHGQ